MDLLLVIIGIAFLIFVHELGHFLAAKFFGVKILEFGIGFPPRIFGKKIGETIYSINWIPLGGFVNIFGQDREGISKTAKDSKRSFINQKTWKKIIILFSGVFMNFLAGWIFLTFVLTAGMPSSVVISGIADNSPASLVGIKEGDIIAGYSNIDDFIKFIDSKKGESIILEINRGGEILEKEIIPRVNPPEGEGALGVALLGGGVEKEGFFKSIYDSFKISINLMGMIAVIFVKNIIIGGSLEGVSGPIGIVGMASQAVGALGIIYLFQILAILALNLIVLNLLPIPALDGGRILFILIEKIKGSPLPLKFERRVNAVGFVLLLVLMLFVTIRDIQAII